MNAVVMMSGGVDSSVALCYMKRDQAVDKITAVWVNYGQINRNRERRAAHDVAVMTHAGGRSAEFVEIDMEKAVRLIWFREPLLTGSGIPNATPGEKAVDAVFVPGRNTLLLSIGLAIAQTKRANLLVMGMHGGDSANFMDCRPDWVNCAAQLTSLHGVLFNAPLLRLPKSEVVKLGKSVGVPYSLTWSCYRGGSVHCGECPACRSRIDAFEEAEILDPLLFVKR